MRLHYHVNPEELDLDSFAKLEAEIYWLISVKSILPELNLTTHG